MSSDRATRYRRLALAQQDKAIADLLLKLETNAIVGFSAWLNGIRCVPSAKMSSRQSQAAPSPRFEWVRRAGLRSHAYYETLVTVIWS
jgi:hypothetical protein